MAAARADTAGIRVTHPIRRHMRNQDVGGGGDAGPMSLELAGRDLEGLSRPAIHGGPGRAVHMDGRSARASCMQFVRGVLQVD